MRFTRGAASCGGIMYMLMRSFELKELWTEFRLLLAPHTRRLLHQPADGLNVFWRWLNKHQRCIAVHGAEPEEEESIG